MIKELGNKLIALNAKEMVAKEVIRFMGVRGFCSCFGTTRWTTRFLEVIFIGIL